MLRVRGQKAVIVGGGSVAKRRAAALLEAGADVTVIAPRIDPLLEAMTIKIERRGYRHGDLAGAMLVVVATDDMDVNLAVAREATERHVLVNRTDDPDSGDIQVPAHKRIGPITVAVHSGGASAKAAAMIRDELIAALDPQWPTLLQTVEPYRAQAQREITDASHRQTTLKRLADDQAMASLKGGGVEALKQYCQNVIRER